MSRVDFSLLSLLLLLELISVESTPAGVEGEKTVAAAAAAAFMVSDHKLEKKFGQSPVFVKSTLLEDGGTIKSATPASLLKEAIHVISCGYEDKTDWGKEVSKTRPASGGCSQTIVAASCYGWAMMTIHSSGGCRWDGSTAL